MKKAVVIGTILLILIFILIAFYTPAKTEASIKFPKYEYSAEDVELLANVMWLENGHTGKNRLENMAVLYYTGAVLVNRARYDSWFPDTLEKCLYQPGQYASSTKRDMYTKDIPRYVYLLAIAALNEGWKVPNNLLFQSQQPRLGKRWRVIDGEYFATSK